ncbi:hypothetical protein ACTOB_001237 [Actinoplanes oblitus]|uniref:Nuclear transport factor 2 family protein n=1 Tax=Actinoplanes oblitus TaxID=3040509 RepID=A0ABY8WII7_9ACTN|nr:hypothetical protein [Actinoplanes oblitus]WIM97689.1 hypothetical protein ACTOB_001237 [Actinoplanes oblitus]
MNEDADVSAFDPKSISALVLDPRFSHGEITYSGGAMAGEETLPFLGWVTETYWSSNHTGSDVVPAFLVDADVVTIRMLNRRYKADDETGNVYLTRLVRAEGMASRDGS